MLWRHGQTVWNAERRFQGQSDIPLDETGEAQAELASRLLAALRPDLIVYSDLSRAAGTAAALLLIALLRTVGLVQRRTTARRAARGARAMDPVVTVVTLPWSLLRALFAMLVIAPFALSAGAIAAGITVSSTLERLTATEAAGRLSGEASSELREVFELLLGLRVEQQVAQVERGEQPRNMLDPRSLPTLARSQMVQAFQVIASHQKQLARYVPIGL